jgi:transcriptional regulator GlxA family with amidase domain
VEQTNAGPGLQVGFLLYPQEFAPGRIRSTDSLRLDPRSMTRAAGFVSLARELALAALQQAPIPSAQAVDGFRQLLEKCELLHQDALLKVRCEIEAGLSQQLYLRHLADRAQMRPDTFYRQFTRRFGVSPIRYRLLARLTHAARLTW